MKIVFLDESTITRENDIDFGCLRNLGEYIGYDNSSRLEAIERGADAEVLMANKVGVTAELLANAENLQLVCVTATGYNNVDMEAAKERGITVCNVSGYAADTVPQHTFALILNFATKANLYDTDVKRGDWEQADSFTLLSYPTFELAGKTIGIIGFGAIGQGVARIAAAFKMNILYYDVQEHDFPKAKKVDLDCLLSESDFVTLHCPLNKQTERMIDTERLNLMKPSAYLINTARGAVVDETALAKALNEERIAGAGIDVLTEEPPKSGSPLIKAKNLIITPHAAWAAFEARQRVIDEVAANISAYFASAPRNVVA